MSAAELMLAHLSGDAWEAVVELAHPGTGARVAAVRAGEGTTVGVPAPVAVQLLWSLDERDRAAAAAGDRRAAVVDVPGTQVAAPPPTSPADQLFAGTAEDVGARLAARTRVPSAALAVHLEADADVAAAAAPHLIRLLDEEAAAAVIRDVVERRLPGGLLAVVQVVFAQRGHRLHHGFSKLTAALKALIGAAAGISALHVEKTPSLAPWAPTAAELEDLTAAALLGGIGVRVDANILRAAISRVGEAADDGRGANAAYSSGAVAGFSWEELRPYVSTTYRTGGRSRQLSASTINSLAKCDAAPQTILDAITDIYDEGPCDGMVSNATLQGALAGTPPDLPTHLGLHMTLQADAGSVAPAKAALTTFQFLGGAWGHRPTAVDVAAYLDGAWGDVAANALRRLASYPVEKYLGLSVSAAVSSAEALNPIWDLIVAQSDSTVAALYSVTSRNPALTGAFGALTRAIEAKVEAGGHGPQLWSAICAMAPGFAGTVDDLVDCCAGLVDDSAT